MKKIKTLWAIEGTRDNKDYVYFCGGHAKFAALAFSTKKQAENFINNWGWTFAKPVKFVREK